MNRKISYIIVSYNVKEYIVRTIQSIYDYSSSFNFEIIVIDNASTDGTITALTELFPDVYIIQNKFNLGFSEANNQGFKIATGDYIFMLNPDAELKENTINILIEKANNHSNLYAPFIENTDGSFQKSYWKTPTALSIFGEILFLNYLKKVRKNSKLLFKEQSVECVSGAAMFFHRTLINKIGYLDPDLFWMEDTDYCFRIRKQGGNILYIPNAKVIHHIGKSSSKNQKIKISNQILSKIKFFKKHNLVFSFVFSILFSFILIIEKIILFSIISFLPVSRKKIDAYLFTLKKFLQLLYSYFNIFEKKYKNENLTSC